MLRIVPFYVNSKTNLVLFTLDALEELHDTRGMNVRTLFQPITFVYNKTHWFSDKEAWAIFKLFAFGETVGWTLLISAIMYRAFDFPGYDIAISVAGRIHGILFVFYFIAVLITVRSMQWGFWRTSMALAAGVPPYTALVFEQIMAWHRKTYPPTVTPPKHMDAFID